MSKLNLILLHGALGSKDQLAKLRALLDDNFTTYELNFSGHGGRELNGKEFTIDNFTNDVINFMQEHQLEKSNFFGYSMGGYVALNLAKIHPEKAQRIFTLGTKLNWSPEVAQHEVKNLNPEKIEEKVPKFAMMLAKVHGPNNWKTAVQKTASMMLGLGNGNALSLDDFQKINTPVKITVGNLDNMVTIEESEKVTNILPNGELEIFEGFKHPIEQIDVEKLATYIKGFIYPRYTQIVEPSL
ncbi:MAG: alpha/beta fold hydrolase [Bacteroidia bacterium]|nr:alpha/beta fold hydrolase [Bacteroidia bacterium]